VTFNLWHAHRDLHSFPTRRSSDLDKVPELQVYGPPPIARMTELLFGADGVYGPDIRARVEHPSSIDVFQARGGQPPRKRPAPRRSEEHTSELQSRGHLVCRLLLEK